jgi:hypothetical protein
MIPAPVHPGSLQFQSKTVLAHHVRVASYIPGGRWHLVVRYSTHRRSPVIWARQTRHAWAAINGGTWDWNTEVPSGRVVANGRIFGPRRPNPGLPEENFFSTGGIRGGLTTTDRYHVATARRGS